MEWGSAQQQPKIPAHVAGNGAKYDRFDIDVIDASDRQRVRARYFGAPAHPLFGILDEPARSSAIGHGVVLCHPHGADYDSAFRSFRILATRLARAGHHVLRFDYVGTGDSSGDVGDASSARWTSDIVSAVEELRRSHDLREVSLVGLRLGATLAALAAPECRGVDRVVLWEPVIDGREYLAAQQALHRSWIGEEVRNGRGASGSDDELIGYQLTGPLRRDLESLSLRTLAKVPAPQVHLVIQALSPEYERLAESLRARGALVDTDCVEGPAIWARTPSMPDPQTPTRAMQAIAAWLTGAGR